MSNRTLYEGLWRDKSISIDTNCDSLLTQMVRINNTGEKTPNLASFGFNGIFNVSCVKNSTLILRQFLHMPRPIIYEITFLKLVFELASYRKHYTVVTLQLTRDWQGGYSPLVFLPYLSKLRLDQRKFLVPLNHQFYTSWQKENSLALIHRP